MGLDPLVVRCLWCGVFEIPATANVVDALHRHSASALHLSMQQLDLELEQHLHPSARDA